MLAVQLSERSQEVQNLKLELTTRVSELDEARLAREATSREILALERKLAEMSGSSARNENDATILRTQLDAASKRAESSGQEVLRLREAVEERDRVGLRALKVHVCRGTAGGSSSSVHRPENTAEL